MTLMTSILFLVAVLAVCVAAAAFGADSRFDRPGRQL
jgi:hypothetical protein